MLERFLDQAPDLMRMLEWLLGPMRATERGKQVSTLERLRDRHNARLMGKAWNKDEMKKAINENIAAAAFLMDFWTKNDAERSKGSLKCSKDDTSFSNFVEIGCGTGILIEILNKEGFKGWGFDARVLDVSNTHLRQSAKFMKRAALVPEPLLEDIQIRQYSEDPAFSEPNFKNFLNRLRNFRSSGGELHPPKDDFVNELGSDISKYCNPSAEAQLFYHDGIFPEKTFIVSYHADEVSGWIPLLAALSQCSFACIPCCAHNLSGQRFCAPSAINNFYVDPRAPAYFRSEQSRAGGPKSFGALEETMSSVEQDRSIPDLTTSQPKKGDFNLDRMARLSEASSYNALCNWIEHLAQRVGFVTSRHHVHSGLTRNIAIVGTLPRQSFDHQSSDTGEVSDTLKNFDCSTQGRSFSERKALIAEIVREDNAELRTWMLYMHKGLKANSHAHANIPL